MFYLVLLCMLLQSLYIFPIYHPLVLVSLLYVNDLLYLSVWKLFFTLLLVIPYQCTSLCLYHRYFSHKSFSTSRFMQFIFAWAACVCYQGGPMLPCIESITNIAGQKMIHIPLCMGFIIHFRLLGNDISKIMSKIFLNSWTCLFDRFSYSKYMFLFFNILLI